jgi:putative sterol carrier protein
VIAKNWEGDMFIIISPTGNLKEELTVYLDLWHGTCRKAEYNPPASAYPNPTFTLTSTYDDIRDLVTGKLNPMTAMMTMKLKVKGNMGYMMRNVPTVLDFVRCMQEVTKEIL